MIIQDTNQQKKLQMNKKRPLINSIFAMVTVTLVLLNSGLIMAGDLPQQEETFYLKSGDKVSGTITAETDDTYVVSTSFGSVTIKKADIIPKKVVGFQASIGSIDYYQMGYDQADKDIKTGDWDIDKAFSIGLGFIALWGNLANELRGVKVPENKEVNTQIIKLYKESNSDIIKIPKMTIEERVNFIINHLFNNGE